MKVIGLIGGMSWNSTLEYYRIINELCAEKLGKLHSARLVLYSLDFYDIEKAQREGRWEDTADILAGAGVSLKRAEADFLLICTNTMHKVADAVEHEAGLPLLNIIDVTGEAIRRQSLRRVGLLGTRFVMEESFYRQRLAEKFGLEVLVPDEDDMAVIHGMIYMELCKGEVKESSRRACLDIIRRLAARGAEGVILGCTELPLLVKPGDADIPLFNTTRLHAEAAVELALAGA
jgi:aspartate racemase